jgi:hypothetical protein
MILMQHFIPIGQRAVSSALTAFMVLAAVPGILAALLALQGNAVGATGLFALVGALLLLGGAITGIEVVLPDRDFVPPEPEPLDDLYRGDDEGESDYHSARYPAAGYEESRRYEAYYGDDETYSDEYEAPPARRSRYDEDDDDPPMPPRRRLPSR